ncbi:MULTISPECIES: hypothetical protein [Nocardia]|uniref:hypothetical protein n=1 Tax=Nocardia TaxID=1817 RepID=UPI000D69E9E3|nr:MULTISPECIES: hypothetical protein [Nocardia]
MIGTSETFHGAPTPADHADGVLSRMEVGLLPCRWRGEKFDIVLDEPDRALIRNTGTQGDVIRCMRGITIVL